MIDKEYIELKEVAGSDWIGHIEEHESIIEESSSKKEKEMLIEWQKTKPHSVYGIELDVLVNGVKPKNSEERELALQNEIASKKRRQEFEIEDSRRKDKEYQKSFQRWRKNWQKRPVEIADFDFSGGEYDFDSAPNSPNKPIISPEFHRDNPTDYLENWKTSETIEMQSFNNLSEDDYEEEESLGINLFHEENTQYMEMKNLNKESDFNLDDKQQEELESQL